MLKKSASFVLGSSNSSTYPRGYASGFDSPAALFGTRRVLARLGWAGEKSGLFEHPVGRSQFPQIYSYRISDGVALLSRSLPIRSPTLEKLSSTP
jgi:hypothetical protein